MNLKIIDQPQEFKVLGLPENYQLEYFGKIDKEIYFVIYRPKSGTWEDFQARIGSANDLKKVEVITVIRFPHGNTLVETQAGTFYFAWPLKKESKFERKRLKRARQVITSKNPCHKPKAVTI